MLYRCQTCQPVEALGPFPTVGRDTWVYLLMAVVSWVLVPVVVWMSVSRPRAAGRG